jgi:hypothetical protein
MQRQTRGRRELPLPLFKPQDFHLPWDSVFPLSRSHLRHQGSAAEQVCDCHSLSVRIGLSYRRRRQGADERLKSGALFPQVKRR